MNFNEFMQMVNTTVIFSYIMVKFVPIFFEFIAFLMERLMKNEDKE